jgi:hypothetical protein
MMFRRRRKPGFVPKPQSRPPVPRDCFDWLPEREIVVGASRKPKRMGVLERCKALYGPSAPSGEAE